MIFLARFAAYRIGRWVLFRRAVSVGVKLATLAAFIGCCWFMWVWLPS